MTAKIGVYRPVCNHNKAKQWQTLLAVYLCTFTVGGVHLIMFTVKYVSVYCTQVFKRFLFPSRFPRSYEIVLHLLCDQAFNKIKITFILATHVYVWTHIMIFTFEMKKWPLYRQPLEQKSLDTPFSCLLFFVPTSFYSWFQIIHLCHLGKSSDVFIVISTRVCANANVQSKRSGYRPFAHLCIQMNDIPYPFTLALYTFLPLWF